ncbi:MAG: helix-turn-helix transcriptional regulator [Rhodospirillales bacterium]|nr:helix-turn-helix transcriptional regulator [Rhodospirillales bacterium]MDE2197445.1 helix-turn-helix transcriptional regulator [Rhodospirillales bacterium]MDE2574435.1 helix-turn-helix transcriptional regulator [Rhodospirillales bacterium]
MRHPEPRPDPFVEELAVADAALLGEIGERLRVARARRGMTRRALSEQSGVSERYLAQMEAGRGNVSVLVLHAVATALAIAPTDLLIDHPARSADSVLLEGLMAGLDRERQRAARLLVQAQCAAPDRAARIALVGLRGAGKSSLGPRLAAARGVPFHELDGAIAREAGLDLPAVFARHGHAGFRELERAALARLVAAPGGAVIAAGGSIVADPVTFALLISHCRTVWLRASPEEHMQRVIDQGDLRPMRDNRQAMDDLRAILASREALYAMADLELDTSARSEAESFAELRRLLGDQ